MQLQVRATSTELGNGSTATITRDLTVQVLGGSACATPACLNPFVSYANDTSAVTSAQNDVAVVARPLVPLAATSPIYAPDLLGSSAAAPGSTESDESMEEWLRRMSQTLGSAFESQMDAIFRDGR